MESTQHRYNPGLLINASIWPVAGLATVFLAGRLWCRKSRALGYWYDDYLLIASWLTIILACAFMSAAIMHGFGTETLAEGDAMTYNVAGLTCSSLAIAWSKTAFAATLLNMPLHWGVKTFIWTSVVCQHFVCYLFAIGDWAKTCEANGGDGFASVVLPGPCWDDTMFPDIMIAQSAFSGFMDLSLVGIAWAIVWKTPLRTQEKIGLGVAMSLGTLAAAVAFARIYLLGKVNLTGDLTLYLGEIAITQVAEPAATIIAMTTPLFRVMLHGPMTDERLVTTGATAERGIAARSTPDPWEGLVEGDADTHLRLVKRSDGRIVLASEAGSEPTQPDSAS
ncbi:hypothetical protein GGR56DRAFT_261213 [Xylariaceae sp. FL0804]|nr:hypothetical protein GGR56DRAFT_261213 [Xylariaceae sp. FL0804]